LFVWVLSLALVAALALESILEIPQFHLVGYVAAFAATTYLFSKVFHV
jgi:hypothetical protein